MNAIGTVIKSKVTGAQDRGTMTSAARDEDIVQLPALDRHIGMGTSETMTDETEDVHQNDQVMDTNDDVSTKLGLRVAGVLVSVL